MKTIFLTMTTTIAVISFAAMLFLNTILGAFGLVATSVETLSNLQTSQKVVEKMKTKHQTKKRNLTKNFAKKSSKKLASTALAAATIGTVAVVATVASLEVSAYCEEQESLQDDANILYGTHDEFDFKSCLKEAEEESKDLLTEMKHSATESVANAMNSTVEYSREQWLAIGELIDSTGKASNEWWASMKNWMHE